MRSPSSDLLVTINARKQVRRWKSISLIVATILLLVVFNKSGSYVKTLGTSINDDNYIASIHIDGIIKKDDYRNYILTEIKEKENIKAVIIHIDSPGGAIVPSEVLYNNIKEISEIKPIVVVMESLAASGGYMVAIASDHIIARNGTVTGSIGVVLQSAEITGLSEKVGIKFNLYKSSSLKGYPSFLEKFNDKGNLVIQESILDSYNFFADLVKKSRKNKLSKDKYKDIFDGRIFTGRQALKLGLVDEIGGQKEALSYLNKVHKINKELEIRKIEIEKKDKKIIDLFFNKEDYRNIYNGSLMAI